MTRLFDYVSKQVIFEDDPTKAEQLINERKAVKLELPEVEKFEQKANEIYENFRKQKDAIKNSENPIYTDEVRQYELNKLEQAYREESEAVQQAYTAYRNEQIEKARVRAAQAVVKVTDNDKQVANQFATRANLELVTSSDKSEHLRKLVDDIALLTDSQRVALQSEILPVLATIDDEKYRSEKRSVIDAVQAVKNPDIMAYEIARKLPISVLSKQRMYDTVTKAIKEHRSVIDGENPITREFYEENLKGKGSFLNG